VRPAPQKGDLWLALSPRPAHVPHPWQINRLIVTGRDCVDKAVGKFMKERERIIAEENAPHNDPNRRPTTY